MSYITADLHRHIGQQCTCARVLTACNQALLRLMCLSLTTMVLHLQTKSRFASFWFDASHIMP